MFNLNLHNFRSFQNQKFNFSRINIFIGENSGGKSSLLKFLLSLKQTLESPNEFNLKL
ncbi:MAG: AAA family ATPase, partial [Bacteroidia bacterium]